MTAKWDRSLGCIEDDLILRVRGGELGRDKLCATLYAATAEESRRFGLPCGSAVQIVLEAFEPWSMLDELRQAIERHEIVVLSL